MFPTFVQTFLKQYLQINSDSLRHNITYSHCTIAQNILRTGPSFAIKNIQWHNLKLIVLTSENQIAVGQKCL